MICSEKYSANAWVNFRWSQNAEICFAPNDDTLHFSQFFNSQRSGGFETLIECPMQPMLLGIVCQLV